MATVAYPHIDLREAGVAYIAGTATKVVEVVLDRLTHHWDAEEICRQHPHLSLAQVYSALAYYYDHQTELDHEVDRRQGVEDSILVGIDVSPQRQKVQKARLHRGG